MNAIRCQCCQTTMTWRHARQQYGRMLRHGFSVEEAKQLSPCCSKCTTRLWAHPADRRKRNRGPYGDNIAPRLDDAMLAQGVWLENAADAVKVYPHLIKSRNALRQERSRLRTERVTESYKEVREAPYRVLSPSLPSTTITYRRAAPGAKKARAVFLEGVTDNPEAWLREKLGPLASFEELSSARNGVAPRV